MKLSDLNFSVPEELIAQYPLKNRDECKLLVYEKRKNKIHHCIFKDIIKFLNPNDILVFNDTKVFPSFY